MMRKEGRRPVRPFGLVALSACLLGLPLAACGGNAPQAQGLMVRLTTSSPQLVSVVALEIYEGDKRVFRNVATVGRGQGEVTLPAELAVQPGANPHDIVTLVGYVGDANHNILGKAVAETTIPENRFAVINLNVDVLCIQMEETTGTIGTNDTDAKSRCTKGQTCKDGQCASDVVDSSTLVDYSGSGGAGGSCFDVVACLGAPSAHTTTLKVDAEAANACTFALEGAEPNVGIIVPGGVPTRLGNVSVLERGTEWSEQSPGIARLSPAICSLVQAGKVLAVVVVATGVQGCSTKSSSIPVCSGKVPISADAGADTGPGVVSDGGPTVTDGGATCTCTTPAVCHKTPGTCNGATCEYPAAQNGAPCPTGTCNANAVCVDACASVTCNTPPVCRGAAGATCASGTCSYPAVANDARCSGTCNAGQCSDPCSGVTCDVPPVCRVAAGAMCNGGTCTYSNAGDGTPCPGGTCTGGVCSNACAGVTCNASNNYCKLNSGTCTAGVCSYPNVSAGSFCPGGTCDGNGTCASDPCSGILCGMSNNPCKTNAGTCSAGVCSYPNAPSTTACPGGMCDGNGNCTSNPCMGMLCMSPGTCQVSPGTCNAGACSYATASDGTPCPSGSCMNGVCTNVCSPNPCVTPPSECYSSPGMCYSMMGSAPMCSYMPSSFGTTCAVGHCDGAGNCTPGGVMDGGLPNDGSP